MTTISMDQMKAITVSCGVAPMPEGPLPVARTSVLPPTVVNGDTPGEAPQHMTPVLIHLVNGEVYIDTVELWSFIRLVMDRWAQ